jgi:hypothetical protein
MRDASGKFAKKSAPAEKQVSVQSARKPIAKKPTDHSAEIKVRVVPETLEALDRASAELRGAVRDAKDIVFQLNASKNPEPLPDVAAHASFPPTSVGISQLEERLQGLEELACGIDAFLDHGQLEHVRVQICTESGFNARLHGLGVRVGEVTSILERVASSIGMPDLA